MRIILVITMLIIVPLQYSHANLIVSVIEVPAASNEMFTATVAGGDVHDRTPNPCWQISGCELRFYTIDESWLPGGYQGYSTVDRGFSTPASSSTYRTLGEFWAAVTNKTRLGQDYLPVGNGDRPCVVVAAEGVAGMQYGTIVSNCAKGIVQAPTCTLSPNQIMVQLATTWGGADPTAAVDNILLACSQDTSVKIETNTGETIPLQGSSTAVAILDWGAGYGLPRVTAVLKGTPLPIPLRVKTIGVSQLDPGVVTGSAVVNISYN